MKEVAFWFWYINSEAKPGKKRKTTWRMTEETALERHPEAVRVPGSKEIRQLPDTEQERLDEWKPRHPPLK